MREKDPERCKGGGLRLRRPSAIRRFGHSGTDLERFWPEVPGPLSLGHVDPVLRGPLG